MFTIQLDGHDSDIRVLGVGSMNTIRGAGREIGKRTWKEHMHCLLPAG